MVNMRPWEIVRLTILFYKPCKEIKTPKGHICQVILDGKTEF